MASTSPHRSLRPWNVASSTGRAATLVGAAAGVLMVAALLSVALPATAQEPAVKIAVVDLEAVVGGSPAGRALQQRLERFQQDTKAEAERMQRGGETREALQRFMEDKQREGQRMQQAGLGEIESSLRPVFERIRDEEGYDLILNRVAGVVIMAGDRLDITRLVIERLGGAP